MLLCGILISFYDGVKRGRNFVQKSKGGILRFYATAEYLDAPRLIATFVQEQGHHVKGLLRAHLRRRGHVQVTCLLEYQKEAPRRSLHLKRRGCRRRLHFSQDEQAHLSKVSSSSAPKICLNYKCLLLSSPWHLEGQIW